MDEHVCRSRGHVAPPERAGPVERLALAPENE
jgi:hypothetical protein